MEPAKLYAAVLAALKARPRPGNLSTNAGWRALYQQTADALASCGIVLTPTQLQRLHWSDRIQTVWDQAQYAVERHYGRQGKRVLWAIGPHKMRVIPRKTKGAK